MIGRRVRRLFTDLLADVLQASSLEWFFSSSSGAAVPRCGTSDARGKATHTVSNEHLEGGIVRGQNTM